MAERKSGPLRPPTIDMTARRADAPRDSGLHDPEADQGAIGPADSGAEVGPIGDLPDADVPPSSRDGYDEPEPADHDVGPQPAVARTDDVRPSQPPVWESQAPPPRSASAHAHGDETADEPALARRAGHAWEVIGIAGLIGALLGTALTYLLATLVPLPASTPAFADPAARLTGVEQRLTALEGTTSSLADQGQQTQAAVEEGLVELNAALADVQSSINETAGRIPAPPDLSGLEAQVRSLSSRVNAVAAGASSADSQALADSLTQVEAALSAVSQRLDALEQAGATTEEQFAELRESLSTAPQPVQEPAPMAPAVDRVALAAGLEAAVTRGAPFTGELGAASAGVPEAAVPSGLAERATEGLPDPESLTRRFASRIPDMLAARPQAATGGWEQSAIDLLSSALAIRPTGPVEGDSSEARLARLEAAMERHDFVTAAGLFAELPEEMRAAAADVATDLELWAAAQQFIAQVRGTPSGAAQ